MEDAPHSQMVEGVGHETGLLSSLVSRGQTGVSKARDRDVATEHLLNAHSGM